jgi:hypothetical protein
MSTAHEPRDPLRGQVIALRKDILAAIGSGPRTCARPVPRANPPIPWGTPARPGGDPITIVQRRFMAKEG